MADLGIEYKEARLQDTKNRQNSIDTNDIALATEWERKQAQVVQASKQAYDWALSNGIAKEQARAVLPEGITASRLYMQGTLRSWLHYIELGSGPETQKEHREVAKACAEVISKIFPLASKLVD